MLQWTRPDREGLISHVRGQSNVVEMFDTAKEDVKWQHDFSKVLGEKARIKGLVTYGKGQKTKHLVVDQSGKVVLQPIA